MALQRYPTLLIPTAPMWPDSSLAPNTGSLFRSQLSLWFLNLTVSFPWPWALRAFWSYAPMIKYWVNQKQPSFTKTTFLTRSVLIEQSHHDLDITKYTWKVTVQRDTLKKCTRWALSLLTGNLVPGLAYNIRKADLDKMFAFRAREGGPLLHEVLSTTWPKHSFSFLNSQNFKATSIKSSISYKPPQGFYFD